jgi:hypothetical protein
MITVENLYWVLFEQLLKPVGLDCFYYYPFGTQNNLSRTNEFIVPRCFKEQHHVLFHFDQEPLWQNNLGYLYDKLGYEAWSQKLMRVLANSEHSQIKKDICRDRGHLDWYFFFHGFAALAWYNDSQFILDQEPISKVFLSLNHLIRDKRSYRIALLARLAHRKILHHGAISFHATRSEVDLEAAQEHSLLTDKDRSMLTDLPDLPMILDPVEPSGSMSAQFGHAEYKMWQSAFVHLVNETVFYEPKLHLTEKIFKPITCLRPFVLAAAPGNLAYLRSYGFLTFSDWIDESYDQETDHDKRLDMIADELQKLCSLSIPQLQRMLDDMMPILQHNKQHLFTNFRRIIVNELVDNFDACVRIWNNGRVDGRQRPCIPDVDSVKRLLLA